MTSSIPIKKDGLLLLLIPLIAITLPSKALSLFVLIVFLFLWGIKKQFNQYIVPLLFIFGFSLFTTLIFNDFSFLLNYALFFLFVSPLIFLIATGNPSEQYKYSDVKKTFEFFLIFQVFFSVISIVIRYLEFQSFDLNFGDVVAGSLRNPFIYKPDSSNVTFTFMMILVTILYSAYFKKDAKLFLIIASVVVIFFASVNHLILALVASVGFILFLRKPVISLITMFLLFALYVSFQQANFNLMIDRLVLIYGVLIEGDGGINNLKLEFIQNYLNDFSLEYIKFLLFGTGLGTYSSRAALFFTGEYVSSFSIVNMSDYFLNNSYYLWNILINAQVWNAGSFNFPYSSLFTFLAEFGLILGSLFLFYLYKSLGFLNDYFPRLQLGVFVFLILSSLVDNYLEYYQATFVFFYLAYLLKGITLNEK